MHNLRVSRERANVWDAVGSPRADQRSVRLGNLHDCCDLADFVASETRLNVLNVTLLRQPLRQTGRVPPSICHSVIAQDFEMRVLAFLLLGLRGEHCNPCHVLPRRFDGARAAITILDSLCTADLTALASRGAVLACTLKSFPRPSLLRRE